MRDVIPKVHRGLWTGFGGSDQIRRRDRGVFGYVSNNLHNTSAAFSDLIACRTWSRARRTAAYQRLLAPTMWSGTITRGFFSRSGGALTSAGRWDARRARCWRRPLADFQISGLCCHHCGIPLNLKAEDQENVTISADESGGLKGNPSIRRVITCYGLHGETTARREYLQ
jgi:hypothetical protein